jgi:predicted esterase YcpF (UPF0227 family)
MSQQIIFLHGLHSSPGSEKCKALQSFLTSQSPGTTLSAPQLYYDPDKNWSLLQGLVGDVLEYSGPKEFALIGSSMGGFYAGCLSQRYGLRAALINPVVEPMALLHRVKGRQQHPVTGEVYTFSVADQQKFERWGMLDPNGARPGEVRAPCHMLLCLGLKDETIDPALANTRFQRFCRIIDPSGGHRFPRFQTVLPEILTFLFPRESV